MNQNVAPECSERECLISLGIREQRTKEKALSALPSILPVFLPFAGCRHRCVFCAQDRQTGCLGETLSLTQRLAKHFHSLQARQKTKKNALFLPMELAFYGGTFTALPEVERKECLEFARVCRDEGLVSRVRCSTRPDEVSLGQLMELVESDVHLVELGVQSFHDEAITASRRGYTGDAARRGCQNVTRAGLGLGIQLLPGMPGCTPEMFLEDVAIALGLHPACLRFYPCLVVDGTPLAERWRMGKYVPWDMPTTIETLGTALSRCWQRQIPVIRLSVAPEASFDAAVLAGPRHPALGSMIQAEALIQSFATAIRAAGRPADRIELPSGCRGFFSGHQSALLPRWEALGVARNRIAWIDGSTARLIWN